MRKEACRKKQRVTKECKCTSNLKSLFACFSRKMAQLFVNRIYVIVLFYLVQFALRNVQIADVWRKHQRQAQFSGQLCERNSFTFKLHQKINRVFTWLGKIENSSINKALSYMSPDKSGSLR